MIKKFLLSMLFSISFSHDLIGSEAAKVGLVTAGAVVGYGFVQNRIFIRYYPDYTSSILPQRISGKYKDAPMQASLIAALYNNTIPALLGGLGIAAAARMGGSLKFSLSDLSVPLLGVIAVAGANSSYAAYRVYRGRTENNLFGAELQKEVCTVAHRTGAEAIRNGLVFLGLSTCMVRQIGDQMIPYVADHVIEKSKFFFSSGFGNQVSVVLGKRG